jgi:hypothetical protein
MPRMLFSIAMLFLVMMAETAICQPSPTDPDAAQSSNQAADPANSRKVYEEVTALKTLIEQMQKVDSKVGVAAQTMGTAAQQMGAAAQIMAVAMAILPVLAVLLAIYEYFGRREQEKKVISLEESIRRFESETNRQIKDLFAESKDILARQIEVRSDGFEIKAERAIEKNINDKIEFSIRSDLGRLLSQVESSYIRSLSQSELVLYSFLQNECRTDSWFSKNGGAMEHLFVFRQLLMQLVAGNSQELLTSIGRIKCEYIERLGESTRFHLRALLGKLQRDSRFQQRYMSNLLEELSRLCEDGASPVE